MEVTMTLREALKIQAEHIVWYQKYRADLADVVARQTDVRGCDLDAKRSILEINERVPRGSAIEFICGLDIAKATGEK